MIKMIVAYNSQNVIGKDNKIPWFYKGDLKFFKDQTMGHVVVMGRKTWESLPPKMRPLPGRVNIVLSSRPASEIVGEAGSVAHSLEEALQYAKEVHPDKDVWLMGGEQVYREGLKHADECVVTWVPFKSDELADLEGAVFMPKFPADWHHAETTPHPETEGLLVMRFVRQDPVERLKQAVHVWRKWAAESGGCSIHTAPGSDLPGSCVWCTDDEKVMDLMWSASEFLTPTDEA